MSIKIVTNNPEVPNELEPYKFEIVFMPVDAQTLLRNARDMVLCGWQLCADPLAGYKVRYNPYHTVFLETSDNAHDPSDDVLRLERAASHMESDRRPMSENTERIISDYGKLDLSLARHTAERLKLYH